MHRLKEIWYSFPIDLTMPQAAGHAQKHWTDLWFRHAWAMKMKYKKLTADQLPNQVNVHNACHMGTILKAPACEVSAWTASS